MSYFGSEQYWADEAMKTYNKAIEQQARDKADAERRAEDDAEEKRRLAKYRQKLDDEDKKHEDKKRVRSVT